MQNGSPDGLALVDAAGLVVVVDSDDSVVHTAAQVNAALRKYVRADGFAIAEAGDFARVKR